MKEQDVIGIKIQIGDAKDLRYVTIRDSYLLLPFSLAKLSKFFVTDVSLQKGIEPVLQYSNKLSVNEKYYAHHNINHYNKEVLLISNFNEWKELITEYCNHDCIILYQILNQFKSLVFKRWKLNIEDYPTISSLSFAIFRAHYLKYNTIPITSGKVFDFIKESYTGGSTDIYIPQPRT